MKKLHVQHYSLKIVFCILNIGTQLSGMDDKELDFLIMNTPCTNSRIIPLREKYSVETNAHSISFTIKKTATVKDVECILQITPNKQGFDTVVLTYHSALEKVPSNLALFKNLKSLDIQANPLYSLEGVGVLTTLQIIDFCDNQKISSLEPLLPCTNLEVICGDNNCITDIPKGIKKLTKLAQISLKKNQLTSFEALTQCKNLTITNLNNNNIESIPESIARNTKLVSLNLGHNLIEDVDSLSPLIPRLSSLNIEENPFNVEKCNKTIRELAQDARTLYKVATKSENREVIQSYENTRDNGVHISTVNARAYERRILEANQLRIISNRVDRLNEQLAATQQVLHYHENNNNN